MSVKDYLFPVIANNGDFLIEQFSGDKNIRCNKLWCSELNISSNPPLALLSGRINRNVNEFDMVNANPPAGGDLYNIAHREEVNINYLITLGANQQFDKFKCLRKGYYKVDWTFMITSVNSSNCYLFVSKKLGNNPSVQLGELEVYLNQQTFPNNPYENYAFSYIIQVITDEDLNCLYGMAIRTGATPYNIQVRTSNFNVSYLGDLLQL